MKHRNGRVITGKITGLLAAGALMLTELAGVCMPVTVMAQDELLVDEAAEETLNTQAPEELVGSEDALLENASAEDTVEAAPEAAEPEDILSDEGDSAFNPDTNIFGNDPSTKDQYYVTFTVNNNGKVKTITQPLAKGTEKPLRDYDFYEQVMTEIDTFLNEDSPARLTGWTVCVDGYNDVDMYQMNLTLNPDGYTYTTYDFNNNWNPITSVYNLDGNKDYHFTANVLKGKDGDRGMYVKAIPSVYYNGCEHVAIGTKAKAGKQVADLKIRVYYGTEAWAEYDPELQAGKDYTLTYSNCKDASMELVRDGEGAGSFRTKVTDDKRPKVTITGKGDYKGCSAEIYFDILPANLGAYETAYSYLTLPDQTYFAYPMTYVNSSAAYYAPGFGNLYKLEGGKVTGIPTQKVYKELIFAGNDANQNLINKGDRIKLELIKGKDYDSELYKWDDANNCWVNIRLSDPSEITEEGDYLSLIRGKGNFCGAYYGDYGSPNDGTSNVFNTGEDGTAAVPAKNNYNGVQFKVTAGEVYDFNKVKVSAKNKQLEYSNKAYGPADFGISVKGADGKELTLDEDYTVYFDRDGYRHYNSIEGVHYGSTIAAANDYVAIIKPIGKYTGSSKSVKVKIKGIQLKAKQFVLSAKKVPYGQQAAWSVAAGQSLVTDNEDSPYYVTGSYDPIESAKVKIQIGGERACGDAIDPSKQVTLTYTHTALSLQDLIDNGTLGFEVDDGEYNVKGAVPAKVSVLVNGEIDCVDSSYYLHNGYVNERTKIPNVGYVKLTYTMKKNTKVGDKATLTVKASGPVTGSKDYTYNVKARTVEYVNGIVSLDSATEYSNEGDLFAVPVFGQQNKGKLDTPKIKLYQVYKDKKGGHLATVSDKLYKLEKKADMGSKSIAVKLVLKNTAGGEFDFGNDGIELDDAFALYEKTIKAGDIASVKIGENSFSVVKGHINGDFAFTAERIIQDIQSVTLTDGTVLKVNDDFGAENGSNRKVGKGTGSVKLTMRYNIGADTFVYGGECTLKFDIKEAKTVKL